MPGLIYCIAGTQKALNGPFKAFYVAYFITGYYTGIPLKRSKTPKFAFLCFRRGIAHPNNKKPYLGLIRAYIGIVAAFRHSGSSPDRQPSLCCVELPTLYCTKVFMDQKAPTRKGVSAIVGIVGSFSRPAIQHISAQ